MKKLVIPQKKLLWNSLRLKYVLKFVVNGGKSRLWV